MGDLDFVGNDPGAVKFGNFINYYSFHSPQERIKNLDGDMFPKEIEGACVCLDIGCNSGELTFELYSYLSSLYPNSSIYILGIDIDPTLITRAKENNLSDNISFLNLNITDEKNKNSLKKYLSNHNKYHFDITFCFSVTMWIHLNNGDDGLLLFLQYIKDISETIIIEPQPWGCYKNAQKRLKKSGKDFPLFNSIKMRQEIDNDIVNFMSNNYKKVFSSSCSSWKRKVYSFYRIV